MERGKVKFIYYYCHYYYCFDGFVSVFELENVTILTSIIIQLLQTFLFDKFMFFFSKKNPIEII